MASKEGGHGTSEPGTCYRSVGVVRSRIKTVLTLEDPGPASVQLEAVETPGGMRGDEGRRGWRGRGGEVSW